MLGRNSRLDHLKPFANDGYSPEQILLWGRYPGTSGNQAQSECLATTTLRHPPTSEVLVAGACNHRQHTVRVEV
jgi:hypothetical protein